MDESMPPARRAAEVVLDGPLTEQHVQASLLGLVWSPTPKLRGRVDEVASAVLQRFGRGRRLLRDELERFLTSHAAFVAAFVDGDDDEQGEEDEQAGEGEDTAGEPAEDENPEGGDEPFEVDEAPCDALFVPQRMQPALGAPQSFEVPALCSPTELAAWLGLHEDELDALCRTRRGEHGRHYVPLWRPRRRAPPRLLEAPKSRLREVQQRLLRDLIARVPAHPAACAFVRGRSVRDAAAPHVQKACVLRMDLEDFFASYGRGRVLRVFLSVGYPEHVARALAALCTTRCPATALSPLGPAAATKWPGHRVQRLRNKLMRLHLPQGAATSPALANLCALPVDRRLAGLARRFGATYTRYADDLVFSGDGGFARVAQRFAVRAAAILLEDGLHVAHHKTRVMRRGRAQRICGLVVNERVALPRRERQRLEAIVHNCIVHGPSTQNRGGVADFRAHLSGRVAWARSFDGTMRLTELFGRIDWSR